MRSKRRVFIFILLFRPPLTAEFEYYRRFAKIIFVVSANFIGAMYRRDIAVRIKLKIRTGI